jgi:hypothetical protein
MDRCRTATASRPGYDTLAGVRQPETAPVIRTVERAGAVLRP